MSKQNKFSSDMSIEQRHILRLEMSDDEIDYSDIPEINDKALQRAVFFKQVRNKRPKRRKFFRSKGVYFIMSHPQTNQKPYSRDYSSGRLVKL